MPGRWSAGDYADIARVAKVAEVDEMDIQGYIVTVVLTNGGSVVATNACCTLHALGRMAVIITDLGSQLVRCSGEH